MQIPGNSFLNTNGLTAREGQLFDWCATPLGDPSCWPESLRAAVSVQLAKTGNSVKPVAEGDLNNIFQQVPYAVCILRGPDMRIEMANNAILGKLWKKKLADVKGKKMLDVFPELLSQPFPALLQQVYNTGVSYRENEAVAYIEHENVLEKYFLDFVYAPLFETDGTVSAVIITVIDVTEKVDTRNKIEEAELRLRLATEAAQLGTFDWDLANEVFVQSPRLAEIFGFGNTGDVSHKQLIEAINPEDKTIRDRAVADSYYKGSLQYEVRVTWPDNSTHWVKVYGKVVFNSDRVAERMYGTVQDVTQEKTMLRLLEAGEQRSRLAIESAQLATFSWDANLDRVTYSPRFTEIFGYANDPVFTRESMVNCIHKDDRPVRDKAVEDSFKTGLLLYEVRIVWPDTSIHWIKVFGNISKDKTGKPLQIHGIVQDITKERGALLRLAESEDRLRIALDSANLGTWDLHLNPVSIFYSRRVAQIFGYDKDILLTSDEFRESVHPDDLGVVVKAHQDAISNGILQYEARIVWQDATIHWIRCNGKTLYNEKHEPVRMIGTLMDITEERNFTMVLQESELLLKTISGTAPVGLWLTDKQGNYIFVNKTWITWTGETYENNLGTGWLAKVMPEDIQETQAKFTKALGSKKYFSTEFRLIKNGNIRWCLTEGYPFYGINGEFAGFAGSVTDITDRKSIESELERKVAERTDDLKRSEERHHKMIDEIQDYAILLLNPDGYIQNWNKGAQKIKGYTEKEIKGKNFRIFYTKEDQENKVPDQLRALAIKNGRAEAEGWRVRKDGSKFWASVVITALHDDHNNVIGLTKVTRDLTERKIVEEQRQLQTQELSIKNYELRQQKEFVDVILNSSVDIISVFDSEMRYISVNKSFEDAYKVAREDILGKKIIEVFPPEKTVSLRRNVERALAGESIYGVVHKSAITSRHYESFFIPLKNNNEIYAVLVLAHDNTEIIEAAQKLDEANKVLEEKTLDLQKANAALEKSNSELEQYAYVASHDLQEPLRKIRTYSGMLNEILKDKADGASIAILGKIINSATRMSNLIYDLLNLSRLLSPERQFEPTDLNKIFENVINDFELVIEQKKAVIEITRLPVIDAVPLQVNQLFYNLVNNALKFAHSTRQPLITVTAEKIDAGTYPEAGLNYAFEYVDIAITDNGIGFSQQYAEQIFEVFKRLHTKQAYQGSGIGLALCRRIVLNHQGSIFAEGKENKGSVFHVILPFHQSKI